jgi:hypothetical protein
MTKIEDQELETWREQWRGVCTPLPELHRKIKRQNFWFVVSNLVAAVGAIAALIFAAWAVRQEPSRLRIAWAIGRHGAGVDHRRLPHMVSARNVAAGDRVDARVRRTLAEAGNVQAALGAHGFFSASRVDCFLRDSGRY